MVALSHRTAGAMPGLVPPLGPDQTVDVTGSRTLRPRAGMRIHRVAELTSSDVVRVNGLPVTGAVRTLVDLAADLAPSTLERAVARALRGGLLTVPDLRGGLAVQGLRPGRRVLGRLLDSVTEPELTRSEAESRLLALVRKSGLPRPRVNETVEGLEVDFLWRKPRLVVEVDGFAYHQGRAAFEHDRTRDARLAAAGYQVIRVTWRQLDRHPTQVLVRVAQALARGS